jgi:hypothetical protein
MTWHPNEQYAHEAFWVENFSKRIPKYGVCTDMLYRQPFNLNLIFNNKEQDLYMPEFVEFLLLLKIELLIYCHK